MSDLVSASNLAPLLSTLRRLSPRLEEDLDWPAPQLQAMSEQGVLGWVVPEEYGGANISSAELVDGYDHLASACLLSTFVLTQQNGAAQRIAGSTNESLKAELLPAIASGELSATVGISHLTTSRQHLKSPVVQVTRRGDGWVFQGNVPWVTGGPAADVVVTGGTLDDNRQILAAIRTDSPGFQVEKTVHMLALNASQTGSVALNNVVVPNADLIAGPIERVMSAGQGGGTGSLTTSALAMGAARASIRGLKEEAERRAELLEICQPLETELERITTDRGAVATGQADSDNPHRTAESIRSRANSLVLRSSQALLASTKGAGFVTGHLAERAVREAMFFLVWSCPQPVVTTALREFACLTEGS